MQFFKIPFNICGKRIIFKIRSWDLIENREIGSCGISQRRGILLFRRSGGGGGGDGGAGEPPESATNRIGTRVRVLDKMRVPIGEREWRDDELAEGVMLRSGNCHFRELEVSMGFRLLSINGEAFYSSDVRGLWWYFGK